MGRLASSNGVTLSGAFGQRFERGTADGSPREEFAIILANTAPVSARTFAERSRPVVDYLQTLADDIDGRQASSVHSAAMAAWAGRIAYALGADEEQRERAVLAARFHDIGKVVVPDSILLKLGSLTEEEWQVVREHPEQGARLVKLAPELEDIAPVIAAHHERPHGDGYPLGLTADEIPLEAAIVAVCDAWSAMLADRPYRKALSKTDAFAELQRCRGSQFDPNVVDAFIPLAQSGALDHRLSLASASRN